MDDEVAAEIGKLEDLTKLRRIAKRLYYVVRARSGHDEGGNERAAITELEKDLGING